MNIAFVGNVSQRYQAFHDVGLLGNDAWRIQKHAHLPIAHHAAPLLHFAQNGSSNHIARLQFIHKTLAQAVYQFCACRARGFGNQRACHMRRVGNACGVVLEAVHVAQFRADAIRQHQAIGGCAVVVGSGEALQMQTPRAACCQDYGVGVNRYQLAFFQVIQHRTHAVALVVGQQFHGGMAV